MTAKQIIELLNLKPLEFEGGYFRETYRSKKPSATAIYYLLTPDTFSALHELPKDEIYHFYLGDPVEMLLLYPDGKGEMVTLGTDLNKNQRPQQIVRAGAWQGSRLKPGGKFALMGTTMAPGFKRSDFELGNRARLVKQYPKYRDLIIKLTR